VARRVVTAALEEQRPLAHGYPFMAEAVAREAQSLQPLVLEVEAAERLLPV
jgi:hypothetical protein